MSRLDVPRLDLAPRQRRPLELWNPFDYMVLIYWSLYFPQAFQWYVDTFAHPDFRHSSGLTGIRKTLRHDPVQRRLLFQGLLSMSAPFGVAWCLGQLETTVSWAGAGLGVGTGLTLGVGAGFALGVGGGVSFGVAFSFVGGVAGAIALGKAGGVAVGFAAVVAVLFSTVLTGSFGTGISVGMARGVSSGLGWGLVIGAAAGVAFHLGRSDANGLVGYAFAGGLILFASRVLDWLVSVPWACWWGPRYAGKLVWIPIPGVRRRLEQWLHQDWDIGVHNVNQVLRYTLQAAPAVTAVNTALSRSPVERLLPRVRALASKPFDWELLHFASADLGATLRSEAIAGLPLPKLWKEPWKKKYSTALRYDTPARCACAGFWLWHVGEATAAADAFERLRAIPFGQELAEIARAIAGGGRVESLADFGPWMDLTSGIEALPQESLLPATLETLEVLRSAAAEAAAAHRAHAPLNRAAALGRAADLLHRLVGSGDASCPGPEWPLIRDVAERWRDAVLRAGGEAGREVLREPVLNPYEGYSGLPVTGETFIGRQDVLREIETRWSTSDPPALVLYGHRRMGKTSILRNLEQGLRPGYLLVYLDMQDSAVLVDHTGQILLDFAEAIRNRAAAAGLDAGPPPREEEYQDLGRARRALNALLTRLDRCMSGEQRLILAIDEFEHVEHSIDNGRVDPGLLAYLRSVNQRHRWLALIFAGLHTLDEMGRDYRNAFFGQVEHVHVGYLSRDATMDLLRRPHPDFALEYDRELADEVYRLTHGQPYLVQRLCWELVRRWNERFLRDGEATPRTLFPDALDPVLDAELYAAAEYYFNGVWSNVTGAGRKLLAFMARQETPWSRQELSDAELETSLEEVVARLARHDVVIETEEQDLRFASELMRRWVAKYGSVS